MSPLAQSAALFALAGLVFLAAGSLASGVAARALYRRVAGWDPRVRYGAIAGLIAMPALVASGLLLSASLPSLLSLASPSFDHCTAHDDGHAHLCFVHLPHLQASAALYLPIVFVATYLLVRSVTATWEVRRASRAITTLAETGETREEMGITIIESAQAICFAAGLLRPRILISRRLLDALSDGEMAVVLAHERAHVRRRDALVRCVMQALASVHVPRVRRWLLDELHLAAEQACDEDAAAVIGDRLEVASTILRVERAAQAAPASIASAVVFAFGERAVAKRVEALLADPAPEPSLRGTAFGISAFAIALLVVADELHHATESFLSVLAQ